MRRLLALVAGLSLLVATGAAFGLTGNNRGEDRKSHTVVAESPQVVEKTTQPTVKKQEPPDTTAARVEAVKETKVEPAAKPAPEDATPPGLVILHPVDGQVFTEKEVAFEGTTEPGARVFAGSYEADVNDDGSWRIVLFLSPGGNHATLKAKDDAGNISSASVAVTYQAPVKEQPKEETKPKESKDEQASWKFEAYQVFGECAENPPYDVFHGKGKPGTTIIVKSEFGNGTAQVHSNGEYEVKVFFESAPVGKTFPVKVKDEFGAYQVFEFTRTG